MAITTTDGLVAGFKLPQPFFKTGITMAAVAANRGYTPLYVAGMPGAATANSAGINGAAVTGPMAGQHFSRTDPVAMNAYLARLVLNAAGPGTFWLIDRIWHNSALVVTSNSAQAITPAAIGSRDVNGAALGDGVMAAMEWSATGGAGTPTVTLTYTNESNTGSKSATMTGVASPPVGTFEVFNLAAGDKGIRSVQSFIQSATRTSGTMHLVLFRILAIVEITAANVAASLNPITGGLPRIYDGTVPQLVWFPSATTAINFQGCYTEAQG